CSAANWGRVQTALRLDWSRKIACGRATEASAVLACPFLVVRVAFSFGCLARRVWPKSRTLRPGLNLSPPQPSPCEGSETFTADQALELVGSPPPPWTVPSTADLLQLVPLRVNSLRFRLTSIWRMSSFTPPKTSG